MHFKQSAGVLNLLAAPQALNSSFSQASGTGVGGPGGLGGPGGAGGTGGMMSPGSRKPVSAQILGALGRSALETAGVQQ